MLTYDHCVQSQCDVSLVHCSQLVRVVRRSGTVVVDRNLIKCNSYDIETHMSAPASTE